MQEYQHYADRTYVAHGKDKQQEQLGVNRALVGKFLEDNLAGNEPSYEDACQHAAKWKKNVCRELVAEVHQRQSHNLQTVPCSNRPCAEHADA